MNGQRIGYVRVSSAGQKHRTTTRRSATGSRVRGQGLSEDADRPELRALLSHVREGDTVFVHSMDQLARNLDDLRRIVRDLTRRGVRVEFAKEVDVYWG